MCTPEDSLIESLQDFISEEISDISNIDLENCIDAAIDSEEDDNLIQFAIDNDLIDIDIIKEFITTFLKQAVNIRFRSLDIQVYLETPPQKPKPPTPSAPPTNTPTEQI